MTTNFLRILGLIQRQYDHVKVHVTLMNTLFRQKRNEDSSKTDKIREKFDARTIIKKYQDFEFGSQKLTEVHLSLRYSTACDGFFEATATLKV